jgi:hypothetical protein
MKFGIIIGVILALTMCVSPSLALNTNVYSLSERNLSINLGPGFEVTQKKVDNCSDGYFVQDLMIANPNLKGVAVLQIMDLYDATLKALNSSAVSEQWNQGLMSAAIQDGGMSAGNWSVPNSKGQNVTVYTVNMGNNSMKVMGNIANYANWNIENNVYVGMLSFFDKNITSQIVKTLDLE